MIIFLNKKRNKRCYAAPLGMSLKSPLAAHGTKLPVNNYTISIYADCFVFDCTSVAP